MEKEILFYDIEVFQEDTIIVFMKEDGTEKVMHNDFASLEDLVKNHKLIGFNNKNFDNYILSAILKNGTQAEIKYVNDLIIKGNKDICKNILEPLDSLDTMQELKNISLKEYMGNIGVDIEETPIPFTINRPLNKKEAEEVIKYCRHDVLATKKLYKERKESYFKPKKMLVDLIENKNPNMENWNTTTLSAYKLAGNNKITKWLDIKVKEELLEKVPAEVRKYWLDNYKKQENGERIQGLEIKDKDLSLAFGFGGLHGAPEGRVRKENVVLVDVASMYPSLIVNFSVLDSLTKDFARLLDLRLQAKKENNEELSKALKLIINSVYGNLNNIYSKLYNPFAQISVCLLGQIALYNLFARLKEEGEIININTDGIAFIPKTTGYKNILKEWEEEWNLKLEEEYYKIWEQKDVNNYVAQGKNGKIIVKGGYVNNFYYNNLGKINAPILDIALVNSLIFGKNIEQTIEENLDKPELYQIILKNTNKYNGTVDINKKEYNKVNRVFAGRDDFSLYRLQKNGNLARFPNSPERMFIYNKSLDTLDLREFKEKIDLEYYINLASDRLEKWKGI